jgi:hypothetical protein
MPIKKECVVCGKEFSVPPCREKTASTCSNECAVIVRAKSRERKMTAICAECGKEFSFPQSHVDRRVYCSYECKYTCEGYKEKQRISTTGDKNPMWKGGETDHCDGYVYKQCPGHPFSSNGYVFKHRLVMEEWLKEQDPGNKFLIKMGDNFYLSPDVVVHHKNSNRKDNSRRNLIAFASNSEHSLFHNGHKINEANFWPNNKTRRLKQGGTKKDLVRTPGHKE